MGTVFKTGNTIQMCVLGHGFHPMLIIGIFVLYYLRPVYLDVRAFCKLTLLETCLHNIMLVTNTSGVVFIALSIISLITATRDHMRNMRCAKILDENNCNANIKNNCVLPFQ